MKSLLRPRLTSYIPHKPTWKQALFLNLDCREAMYGGAAGGGKSDALLMAALQYVDVPGYTAILFRRTYQDLALPEAIMDRSKEWLLPTDAEWNEKNKTWTFPSGARLVFGYLKKENDKYRYQSAAFQFIGFDEATQFQESQYTYLFSRLRRLQGVQVPLRMRAASNPGGVGHEWVKRRFVETDNGLDNRKFVPSTIEDNPHLDRAEYVETLQELDPLTRKRLMDGDWGARESGGYFKREWFNFLPESPSGARQVRFWDLAGTEPTNTNPDPDYTSGTKMAAVDGQFFLQDTRRVRKTPGKVQDFMRATAHEDGVETEIWIEQEPGASGKFAIDQMRRGPLRGFTVRAAKITGNKEVKASPLSSAVEAGNVYLCNTGRWELDEFLEELVGFPEADHDDQVDSASGAYYVLTHYAPSGQEYEESQF